MNGKADNLSERIGNSYILLPFLFLLAIAAFLYPHEIKNYYTFVDWHTLAVLAGLLMVTTAIKESAVFLSAAKKVVRRINNERHMALVLIVLSSVLSMFLTNDIALFIMVPLTLAFQEYLQNDLGKLVIFEAIAVNVGSTLTPIGNPQNLFLWHQWEVSFIGFAVKMFPLFVILFAVLMAFVVIIFPSQKLAFRMPKNGIYSDKKLFYFSIVLLPLFISTVEFAWAYYALAIVFLIYAVFFRKVLKNVDWLLIVLLIVMFIDFHIISLIPAVSSFISRFNMNSSSEIFTLSLFSSQIISNVPASIFMSKFSSNWFAIAYGVNVGGNGLVIGSIANIIALRLVNKRKSWLEFHKYSLPYFILTAGLVYLLFSL